MSKSAQEMRKEWVSDFADFIDPQHHPAQKHEK
jgi:hypothetical protein